WLELAVAVNLLESFERGLVRFGRAPSQHLFGQNLTRERWRRQGERLRPGKLLAVNADRGNFAIFNREERFARRAFKDKDVSRLRDLRDGFNQSPVAFKRDQRGRRRKIAVPQIVLDRLEMPHA